MKTKIIKEIGYVELYAKKLREDSSFFKQQKMLIESQMRSSRAIFKNSFGDKNFIISAREYLREIGMIK